VQLSTSQQELEQAQADLQAAQSSSLREQEVYVRCRLYFIIASLNNHLIAIFYFITNVYLVTQNSAEERSQLSLDKSLLSDANQKLTSDLARLQVTLLSAVK
jgi:hypothetical protein